MERLREKPQSATAALCEGPQLGPGGPAGQGSIQEDGVFTTGKVTGIRTMG